MGRRLAAVVAVVFVLLVAGAAAVVYVASRPISPADVVAANSIAKVAEEQWPLDDDRLFPPGPDFVVIDSTGQMLAARGINDTDEIAAFRERWPSLPVRVDGVTVGTVLVDDTASDQLDARQRTIVAVSASAFATASLVVALWSLWLWRAVVAPFRRLDRFAARVGGGDLDAPLERDRHNVFGSFTEAFDIMRTSLAESRLREAQLAEDKQTLVAQLSHDIRTPVASLGATAELLQLTEFDPAKKAKLEIIGRKVEQVTDLLDDLFQASAEDLTDLPVEPEVLDSAVIRGMVPSADITGQVIVVKLPGVLVRADPKRLQQVIDNILANAAKYAGTPVAVVGAVRGKWLRVTFTDAGPGVPDNELDLIIRKRVRGSNASDKPGSGLGLYTSTHLMERMGGDLAVRNVDGGFQVQLDIALAGTEQGSI